MYEGGPDLLTSQCKHFIRFANMSAEQQQAFAKFATCFEAHTYALFRFECTLVETCILVSDSANNIVDLTTPNSRSKPQKRHFTLQSAPNHGCVTR